MSGDTASTSTEIVVNQTVLPLSDVARERFTQGLVTMLVVNKAPDAPPAIVHAWLEQAAIYDLDPIANEIWLAKMGNQYTVLVGRDGYLKIAKRDPSFVSCNGAAVYEKDEFSSEYIDDEQGWKISHKIGNPAQRGKLLGGWAKLVRRGKPTEFFFAPLEQFKGGGAWKYADTMIVKCAVSYLLRTTYSISGPAPSDELNVGFITPDGEVIDERPQEPELPAEVAELVARAAEVDPKRWRANEVLARLPIAAQVGQEQYDAAIAQVRGELERWLEENEIADAEVIKAAESAPDAPQGPEATGGVSDPRAACQARYEADEEFRSQVDRYLGNVRDLQAAYDDATGPEQDSIGRDLDACEQSLRDLGVPPGWEPQLPGQMTLEG